MKDLSNQSTQNFPGSLLSDTSELSRKRAILLSARLQFSPEIQPIREAAIDRCVERVLLAIGEPLSLSEIADLISVTIGTKNPAVSVFDIRESLARLRHQGNIVISTDSIESRYSLSPEAENAISHVEEAAERRIRAVFQKLFPQEDFVSSDYSKAFVDFLSRVFSTLAETYVRILQGHAATQSLFGSPLFRRAVRRTLSRFSVDEEVFTAAATRFFQEVDPEFAALQWNFAQGYYIAKCLGLDSSGALLSTELLNGATLYLDTNVVLHGLSQRDPNRSAFESLSRACARNNIELKVSQITLDELRSVVSANKRNIPIIASRVPPASSRKIRNVFFEDWHYATENGAFANFEAMFVPFEKPVEYLAAFGVGRIDDRWFDEAVEESETQGLVEDIVRRSQSRLWGPKTKATAQHDALMLRWVDLERRTGNANAWFVTLDKSLPSAAAQSGGTRPLAITLDALLHWISPFALMSGSTEHDVADFFAQALRYQILPCDNFLDVTDFKLFAEMEFDSRSMPASDVENCLRSLKSQFGVLNPRDPREREQLARMFGRYWADPSRKYAAHLHFLEKNVQSLEETLAIKEEQYGRETAVHVATIGALTSQLLPLQLDKEQRDHRKSFIKSVLRQTAAPFAFLACSSTGIYLSLRYGQGANWWQKMANSSGFFSPFVLAAGVLATWISGNSRLSRLISRFRSVGS